LSPSSGQKSKSGGQNEGTVRKERGFEPVSGSQGIIKVADHTSESKGRGEEALLLFVYICTLIFQRGFIFYPEDGGRMFFWNVGNFVLA
jgi:hypothetical protein